MSKQIIDHQEQVRRGRAGGLAKWAGVQDRTAATATMRAASAAARRARRQIVRLDQLTPEERAVVLALVDAKAAANAATQHDAGPTPSPAPLEVSRDATTTDRPEA